MNPAKEKRRRREDQAVNVVSLKLSWLQQFKMLLDTTSKTGAAILSHFGFVKFNFNSYF